MKASLRGERVHIGKLAGKNVAGYKGINRLRDELRPALDEGVDIIDNHYHGEYSLLPAVIIGEVRVDALANRLPPGLVALAREVESLRATKV